MTTQGTKGKNSTKQTTHCKLCGAPIPPPHEDPNGSPFCSERCRMNDLSKWFGENYRIASHPMQSSQGEDDTES